MNTFATGGTDHLSGTPISQIQLNIQQPTATQQPPIYPKHHHTHIDEIVSDINRKLDDEPILIDDTEEEESDFSIPSYIWKYLTLILIYVILSNNYVRNQLSIYIPQLSNESHWSVWLYGILFAFLYFLSTITFLKYSE